MSESVFSHFTSSKGSPQVARPTNGGKPEVKELPYSPPKGPTSQMQQGPGLHGTNHGCCGTQGKR